VPADAVFITATQVRQRYGGMSHMWLENKLKHDPDFPRAHKIGGMRMFRIADLEAFERQRVVERPAAPTARGSRGRAA
jgi:hypothetical protein